MPAMHGKLGRFCDAYRFLSLIFRFVLLNIMASVIAVKVFGPGCFYN